MYRIAARWQALWLVLVVPGFICSINTSAKAAKKIPVVFRSAYGNDRDPHSHSSRSWTVEDMQRYQLHVSALPPQAITPIRTDARTLQLSHRLLKIMYKNYPSPYDCISRDLAPLISHIGPLEKRIEDGLLKFTPVSFPGFAKHSQITIDDFGRTDIMLINRTAGAAHPDGILIEVKAMPKGIAYSLQDIDAAAGQLIRYAEGIQHHMHRWFDGKSERSISLMLAGPWDLEHMETRLYDAKGEMLDRHEWEAGKERPEFACGHEKIFAGDGSEGYPIDIVRIKDFARHLQVTSDWIMSTDNTPPWLGGYLHPSDLLWWRTIGDVPFDAAVKLTQMIGVADEKTVDAPLRHILDPWGSSSTEIQQAVTLFAPLAFHPYTTVEDRYQGATLLKTNRRKDPSRIVFAVRGPEHLDQPNEVLRSVLAARAHFSQKHRKTAIDAWIVGPWESLPKTNPSIEEPDVPPVRLIPLSQLARHLEFTGLRSQIIEPPWSNILPID